jgi:hypothetical protein
MTAAEFDAAVAERLQALETSGLPVCAWVLAWEAMPRPAAMRDSMRHDLALMEHTRACTTCDARVQWAEARFGPWPQLRLSPLQRLATLAATAVMKLPAWALPPIVGALAATGFILIRIAFFALTRGLSAGLLRSAGEAVLVAAWVGAAAGFGYSAAREPLRRFGRLGDYGAGIACVAAAILSYAVPSALLVPDSAFRTGFGWTAAAAGSVVLGAILGHNFPELDRK